MNITLVTEKGTVAQAIAAAILEGQPVRRHDHIAGVIAGDQVRIIWPDGHALDLAPPEYYKPVWGAPWIEAVLPIVPPGYRFELVPTKPAFVRLAKELLAESDLVVNACDPAREGELIFHEIVVYTRAIRPKVKVERMWLQSTTPEGVRRAWAERDDGMSNKYLDLCDAATARREADWLWGINFTRKISCVFGRLYPPANKSSTFHIGRVQTPVLKIVFDRAAKIEAFKAKEFYRMFGEFTGSGGQFRTKIVAFKEMRLGPHDTFFKSFADVSEMRRQVTEQEETPWAVIDRQEVKADPPPAPFTLGELQQAANIIRYLRFTAKETLDCAQRLYFVEKAITYPRTNSSFFPRGDREHILKVRAELFSKWAKPLFPGLQAYELPPATDQWFDDDKVTDHHAIMPTGVIPAAMDEKGHIRAEYKLWQLIAMRFIQAFLPDAQILAASRILLRPVPGDPEKQYRATLECAPVVQAGWMEFEEQTFNTRGRGLTLSRARKDVLFPECNPPEAFLRHTFVESGQTTRPLHHDDAMLLGEMIEAGLGTAATRAQIIEDLMTRGYLYRTPEGLICVGPAGNQLMAILAAHGGGRLTDAALTASWEQLLDRIGRRVKEKPTRTEFLDGIRKQIAEISDQIDGKRIAAPLVLCPASFKEVKLSEDKKRWEFGGRYEKTQCWVTMRRRKMTAADYRDIFVAGAKGGGPFAFLRKSDEGDAPPNPPERGYEAWVVYRPSQEGNRQWDIRFKTYGRKTLSVGQDDHPRPPKAP